MRFRKIEKERKMIVLTYPGIKADKYFSKAVAYKDYTVQNPFDFFDEKAVKALLDEVEQNDTGYSVLSFNFAIWNQVRVRKLEHAIVYPTLERFTAWINDNGLENKLPEYSRLYRLDEKRFNTIENIKPLLFILKIALNDRFEFTINR